MIIDGKAIAEDIYAGLAASRGEYPADVRLGIVVQGSDPVIESFVRIKRKAAERLRVDIIRADRRDISSTDEMIGAVTDVAIRTDALIVQLPLPMQVDTDKVLAAIPTDKDVDGINPLVAEHERLVFAPVACAVEEILKRSGVAVAGKRAVVVGAGRLVGAPVAALLKRCGAEVTVITLESGTLSALIDADIVVLGAGNPHFIKPEHLKEGVVLIDAGTSESAGKVVGDADPACAEKAALFTPVPGGVGPIAVAMIFRNLFELVKNRPQ